MSLNDSSTFRYTPFVSACFELATRATTTGKFADELDALLRKAACLDPRAFGVLATRYVMSIMNRCSSSGFADTLTIADR